MSIEQPHNWQKMPLAFWFGVGFFVAVITAVLWLAVAIYNGVNQPENMPITQISIDGNMPYTQKNEVLAKLKKQDLSNYFQLDVNQIRQSVASLPWVYSVAVRKQWPNELQLYIVDQTPAAIWNGDFILNKQGKAFQAEMDRIQQLLPAFFGPEGSEHLVLENYQNLSELLHFGQLAISELILSERYSWQLTLSDGVILNLGQEKRFDRIRKFLAVYSKIKAAKPEHQQVDYVDLRYDTGMAVGWKQEQQDKRAS